MADTATEARKFSDPQVPKERKLSDTIPMESVQRLAKLPVVESSLNIATDVYSRVKEANSVLNWTLSTAESTVSRAVEHALPVAERLEKPLKRMDTLLCSSLDYVEAKVPAVKLPTQELLETTSSYVEAKLQPALEKAAELKQFGAEKVSAVKNFAMESSNTSQLVSNCTKMAATGMEVAQRYISNAGVQLTNGEATLTGPHANGYGQESDEVAPRGAISPIAPAHQVSSHHRHPIYTPEAKRVAAHTTNGHSDSSALPSTPSPNTIGPANHGRHQQH